ncbi:hypothetical protein ACSEQ1_24210 [Pseudomonas aeruginosa]
MKMANYPGLFDYLKNKLAFEFSVGPVNLELVRSYISSPRLFDFYSNCGGEVVIVEAGDTFLDRKTMLADGLQSTYAVSYMDWQKYQSSFQVVEDFDPWDRSIINVQVWPYAPTELDDFQMLIAVALSYTRNELDAESRISLAIHELVSRYGFYADEF